METREMQQILQRLNRIDKKLNNIFQKTFRETWVTAHIVYVATGWDYNTLRVMKGAGVIKYDDIKKRYLLESIPDMFIVKK